ncbi:low temperature requirement protein A [Lentzea sp. NBRC 105346]|uniref:low temperature requirement protein A n=1 Tax=Lentzea sp. NBRC 105346 TaxID=3032205 RepID=UPI0024A12A1A|nr:low temperature requirement protein A [Lentzea sp. NBRC 105346]GLZ34958.1 low temperature requirement protein A [Lentzea sp. NBRC 105346]
MSESEPEYRVTTLELFFDLVFVFTLTQLTALLADDTTLRGLARVVLMLMVILWMYGGYAWLTNAVAPDTPVRRTLLMIGMGGFLLIALAIPDAFGGSGVAFGIGYLIVNLVHSGLFVTHGGPGSAEGMRRLSVFNLGSAIIVLAGGFLPTPYRYAAYLVALLVMVLTPYVNPQQRNIQIRPGHFVERHGLVVIVALGESIVAIGVGAAGLPVNGGLVLAVAFGLVLAYQFWWSYFGGNQDEIAERQLSLVPPTERARKALAAYGWAHAPILLGIVVLAVGVKKTIGHATDHLKPAAALALAGGVALFLLGEVAFRWVLRIGPVRRRAIGAVAALATVPLGLWVALAQVAALTIVFGIVLIPEVRQNAADERVS